jgi:hypothetical protein
MGKLFSVHPSDDQLDLYLLNRLSLEQERLIEEHSLICAMCLDRLSLTADFIAVLRAVREESLKTTNYVPRIPVGRAAVMT